MKNGFLAGQPQEASQAAVFSKIKKSEMKNEFLASQLREATQPPSQLEISKYQKFKIEKWISAQPAVGASQPAEFFQKSKIQK